jgi:hypothetical protein
MGNEEWGMEIFLFRWRWVSCLKGGEGFHGIEEGSFEALDAEVDRGEQAVGHEDEVPAVGIGDGEGVGGIEKSEFAVGAEGLPSVADKEIADLVVVDGRGAGDGGLLDEEAEAGGGFYGTEKTDLVAEEAVVPMPALQVVDGRGAGVFVGAMDDFQAEEPGSSGLEERAGGFAEPDLVFVAVVGRGLPQLCRRRDAKPTLLAGECLEDVEFLEEMGVAALKAASCLAASAEFFNTCLERDSRRACVVHIRSG